MKREIINFYAGMNIPIEKLISIGKQRRGLTEAAIIAAAEAIYGEIQGGVKIKPTRISWDIFNRAKLLMGQVEKKELDKTIGLQNDFDDLMDAHATLETNYNRLQVDLKAADMELENKKAELENYLKELIWYRQPWWKTIFRRPANG